MTPAISHVSCVNTIPADSMDQCSTGAPRRHSNLVVRYRGDEAFSVQATFAARRCLQKLRFP